MDPEWRHQVLVWLGQNTPPPRIRHILGVETMARQLAQIHGVDPERAATAALLHDLAKYFPPEHLLAMAEADPETEVDAILRAEPHLLHADVSAIVAHQQFGLRDPEIQQAIRDHTLGRPDMGLLSCLIFVADALEPHRGDHPVQQRLREVAKTDLITGVAAVCDYGLGFLLGKPKVIHPRTIAVRNAFWQRSPHPHMIPVVYSGSGSL
ncbi:MAG: bis(5'-nucleosyl)-tetraphosphatase (symmetrical) YqeK [Synechococcales cyanobacterium]